MKITFDDLNKLTIPTNTLPMVEIIDGKLQIRRNRPGSLNLLVGSTITPTSPCTVDGATQEIDWDVASVATLTVPTSTDPQEAIWDITTAKNICLITIYFYLTTGDKLKTLSLQLLCGTVWKTVYSGIPTGNILTVPINGLDGLKADQIKIIAHGSDLDPLNTTLEEVHVHEAIYWDYDNYIGMTTEGYLYVEPKQVTQLSAVATFTETSDTPVSTEKVIYQILVNGTYYYFNTGWKQVSNKQSDWYLEANDATVINTNKATIPFASQVSQVGVRVILLSDATFKNTPKLESLVIA